MTNRLALLLAAAALTALPAQNASAQTTLPLDFNTTRHYTPEEQEKMREIDKQYQETLKKVPDKQKTYDPWAGTRQDSSNGTTTKR